MTSSSQNDYAIIGGGSVGPLAVIYLAEEFKKRSLYLDEEVTIHAYDPGGFCNGGIAYKDQPRGYKLNSVYAEMSPWDPGAFFNYAHGQSPDIDPLDFSPRATYLDFLKQTYDHAVITLKEHGVTVEEHKVAVGLRQGDTAGDIGLHAQEDHDHLVTLPARQVLLSVGYGPNERFPALQSFGGEGYVHNFYDRDQVQNEAGFQKDAPRILFIGNGPALYDFTNTYEGDPVKTQLTVVARNGHLLDVRDVSVEEGEQPVQTPLIDALPEDATFEGLKAGIADQLVQAQDQGATKRRAAFDMISALKPKLETLAVDVVKAFNRSAEHSQLVHTATPIPKDSHNRLQSFDPSVIKGCFREEDVIVNPDGSFTVTVDGQAQEVDIIINGTGHGRTNHPILKALQAQNLAEKDERFGTLKTEEDGIHLSGSGIASIGPATHWGVDGIESFARKVEPLVSQWVDQIQSRQGLSVSLTQALGHRAQALSI